MSSKWLITEVEDDRLQGLTCEAQVMYLRGFRRYANFDTGVVTITHGVLKRLIEFIPDNGCHGDIRRVADVTTDYVRARIAELERAELIEKMPKRSRFEAPVFRCAIWPQGLVCPKKEPQRNPKEGTPSENPVTARPGDEGTPKEPQGGNPKISGYPVKTQSNPEREVGRATPGDARGARLTLSELPPDWRDYLLGKRQDLDPVDTWERFRDYWIAQPGAKGRKSDWAATWRTWVRNEKPRSNGHEHRPPHQSIHDRRAAVTQQIWDNLAQHDFSEMD